MEGRLSSAIGTGAEAIPQALFCEVPLKSTDRIRFYGRGDSGKPARLSQTTQGVIDQVVFLYGAIQRIAKPGQEKGSFVAPGKK
jgi:hypothetical protein